MLVRGAGPGVSPARSVRYQRSPGATKVLARGLPMVSMVRSQSSGTGGCWCGARRVDRLSIGVHAEALVHLRYVLVSGRLPTAPGSAPRRLGERSFDGSAGVTR